MPIHRTILDELTATVRAMLVREMPERVLFMTGEAGIGKSTLIKQLLVALETDAKPPIVAMAECSTPVAGSGVGHVEALKPFADIMSGLVEAGSKSAQQQKGGFKLDIGKFFVDTAPSWLGLIPILGSPIFHAMSIVGSGYDQLYLHKKLKSQGATAASSQEQVFRQYINFLSKLSEELPVLVVLDDFHWADTSSTNLLFASARDLAASQVVFLVVYREGDIKRSSDQDDHPILRVRNEIERYSMSREIEVPPADRGDIQALIQAQYREYKPDDVLEQWLLRISDGNLLFATQFLATLEHDLYLEPRSAVLLKDLATVPVPSSANAVVIEHIRRLSTEDKEQLRYASVEGETVTAHMVSRFLELPMIKMLQRLRVLEEQHHILRSLGKQSLYAKETTAYQFVHFLVHKTLYEDLGDEERSILHGIATDVLEEELATAEESQHNVHKVAARLAAHAIIAERHQAAAQALLKGAKWVWQSFAADEALYFLDQCRAVVQAQKKPSSSSRSFEVDALLLKGAIQTHRARYTDALDCYEEALAKGQDIASPAQRSETYVGISNVKWFRGLYAEAESDARVALKIANDASDTTSSIRALRIIGNTYYSRGLLSEAYEFYQQSLDLSVRIADESGRASAVANIANVLRDRGQVEIALANHQQALSIRRTLLDTAGITRELINVGFDLTLNRRFEESMESYEEALKLAHSSGALKQEASILNSMAVTRTAQERFEEALELAQRSLVIKERIGDRLGVVQSLGTIGNIYKDTNETEHAIEYFAKCMNHATELNNRVAVAKARHSIAFTLCLQDQPTEALPHFEISRQLFTELGAAQLQIEAAYGAACCMFKLEARQQNGTVHVKANDLLERTRSLVRDEDFSIAGYENIGPSWGVLVKKLGITLED